VETKRVETKSREWMKGSREQRRVEEKKQRGEWSRRSREQKNRREWRTRGREEESGLREWRRRSREQKRVEEKRVESRRAKEWRRRSGAQKRIEWRRRSREESGREWRRRSREQKSVIRLDFVGYHCSCNFVPIFLQLGWKDFYLRRPWHPTASGSLKLFDPMSHFMTELKHTLFHSVAHQTDFFLHADGSVPFQGDQWLDGQIEK
jgi:hypothetical protein